ncbi:NAD(P)-dependent oxidoreductase [Clostridium sp. B9]|uniref:NAD(P)-dependent oxidoreductase n=1 Tax=Clostridium sp. B9 TaxID=3423224 RepID=UPI003D2F506D
MKKIAFVGVGIMGKSMVRNLMKAGFLVNIFARNKSKVLDVIEEGAKFHPSIAECVKDCDVVITIVGFPKDVEEVYFDESGILNNVKEGTYLIDMTTSSPELAKKIYDESKRRRIKALDAPVTGGDIGAKNGTLSILVGGDEEDFNKCMPIFEAMGNNIHYEGQAGFGQHTKLANQIMIAGAISGVCEAMAYAEEKGLNIQKMLDSVSKGAAGSRQLELVAPKVIVEDFEPGFFIKHFIKDMKLAKEESEKSGLSLDILSDVLENYEALEKEGFGDLGTQALIKHYEK